MSVNWGQQLLDFLGVGCCSIRVWWRVLAAQQSWLFFVLLLVSWCSRCFHWWKIRTAGRPVQHLTLLLWSCAPGIGGVVNCVHWQSFLEVFLLQLLVFGTTWFSLLLTCRDRGQIHMAAWWGEKKSHLLQLSISLAFIAHLCHLLECVPVVFMVRLE